MNTQEKRVSSLKAILNTWVNPEDRQKAYEVLSKFVEEIVFQREEELKKEWRGGVNNLVWWSKAIDGRDLISRDEVLNIIK